MALEVEHIVDGGMDGEKTLGRPGGLEALHTSFALSQWLMGILCPVIPPTSCVVAPRKTKFAQRSAVGSELVGHDGGWNDALFLQKFSHQLERRLAVSTGLNEDIKNLAFAVHGNSLRMKAFRLESRSNWAGITLPRAGCVRHFLLGALYELRGGLGGEPRWASCPDILTSLRR